MKHTIEIDGLPEGWEAVAYRRPKLNIDYVFIRGRCELAGHCEVNCYHIIVKKKQPRRIVLEEVNTVEYDLLIDNVTYNIVEDSGENDD